MLTSLMLKGRRGRSSDFATILKRCRFTARTLLLLPEIEVAGIRTRPRISVGKIERERIEEINVEVIGEKRKIAVSRDSPFLRQAQP